MKILLCIAMVFAILSPLMAQRAGLRGDSSKPYWKQIAGFFLPPAELTGQYGNYRSPLQFRDGRMVTSPADWKRRREEIRSNWMKMMGEWPPLLTTQRMTFLDSTKKDGFMQYVVRFKWTPTEETTGYLLVPEGGGKKAAVITVYYEPETAIGMGDADHPLRDFAYQLAKRGFVTLSIGTTQATKDRTYGLYYPSLEQTTVQPLSMLGCAAANAWHVLAKLPQVDSTRIGIMGHSFGGKWAMFASCLFDRFAAAVWSDPGIVFDETNSDVNYWEPWYLGYHPRPWRERGMITQANPARGLYPKSVADGYDLHELHALMAPRPFLVSGGAADTQKQWVPLNHSIKVNWLLGYANRVAMTNRPKHGPTVESNAAAYAFLQYFLQRP